MSTFQTTAIITGLTILSRVSAHGLVSGIVAGGVWSSGYSPNFQYQNPPPTVAGWSIPKDESRGFVSDYTSPDIICHIAATPGGSYVTVAAGGTVELQWTTWPSSHHGPMLDYLAHCANDDCTTVDKTTLKWNKIDEAGLISDTAQPGVWASDQMIANNNSWVTTIPSSIAPGKYVLRHETIALHSAGTEGGAQNYPQCVNLEITGSGTDSLAGGTAGTSLYTSKDPGTLINIYQILSSYTIPGPPLYSKASNSTQPTTTVSTSSTFAPTSAISTSTLPTSACTTKAVWTTPPADTSIMHPHSSVIITDTPTAGIATPISSSSSSVAAISSPPVVSSATPPSSSAPVSFTSTVTGRVGKPTKFTCYAEE